MALFFYANYDDFLQVMTSLLKITFEFYKMN